MWYYGKIICITITIWGNKVWNTYETTDDSSSAIYLYPLSSQCVLCFHMNQLSKLNEIKMASFGEWHRKSWVYS